MTDTRIAGKHVAFGTPRKLPKADSLVGRVVVLDIAFASEAGTSRKGGGGFVRITQRFIEKLGGRLAMWVDHHDSSHHASFADDPRFVLATKAEHGACPEMIDPAVVERAGHVDTVVCHSDFDGLASAAKWLLGGELPYAACDDDARAVDTCIGVPSPIGARIDAALRGRPRDEDLYRAVVRLLVSRLEDAEAQAEIDEAADLFAATQRTTEQLAEGYELVQPNLAFIDIANARHRMPDATTPYDKTMLLLLGQKRAQMSLVLDGDTATFAAAFDSGVNFLDTFGISGGMPTRVSVARHQLDDALGKLGIELSTRQRLLQGRAADS